MITLKLGNAHSNIHCDVETHRALVDVLSYEVEGAHFAKQYNPYWDGRVKHLDKKGNFPTGLLWLVIKHLKENGQPYHLVDHRKRPGEVMELSADFSPMVPRPYQEECVLLTNEIARGVFHMGTGAGKSLTAALIVARRGLKTLIIAPDTGLREQLFADFEKWFGEKLVTKKFEDKPIVIANIQALAKKDKEFFKQFEMLIIDEFHHAAALTYRKINDACENAFYRYGFTGTFVRPDGQDMTMHGVLSNVIFEKTTSELIEEGFLVRPYITVYKFDLPKPYRRLNYHDAYDTLSKDQGFAMLVKHIAEQKIAENKQTLILVRRKEHGAMLSEMIEGSAYLNGDDTRADREHTKKAFIDKNIRCLIATQIFGEGIDIPTIDVLINARAEKTEIQTSQGIGRALRKADGKDKAEVFDFLFTGQRNLQSHSVERCNTYRKQSAFVIEYKRAPDLFL